MKKRQTFEDYLNEDCCPSEMQTNNSPEGFERWLEDQDISDIIEYAEGYGIKMYELGEKVGFPKDTDEYDSRLQIPNETINVLTERN
jgi:hypothetical protein